MFRNERYFDKNDNKKNFFGQFEDVIETGDREDTQASSISTIEEDKSKKRDASP